jgi:predicted transcriptional regulator
VRTTVDIPDDLHAQATALARDTHQSLSRTITVLLRRGLSSDNPGEITSSSRTGLPVVRVGRMITTEDVRRLEDDDQ